MRKLNHYLTYQRLNFWLHVMSHHYTSNTFCRVYNPHTHPIWIRWHASIATIEYVHSDHILTSINAQTPREQFITFNQNMMTLDDLWIQLANDNLNDEEWQQLTEILIRNTDIFATDLSHLPECTLSKHTIRTVDASPQRQRHYNHSSADRREIERQTADVGTIYGIIEPSDVSSSTVVLVKKKIIRHAKAHRL